MVQHFDRMVQHLKKIVRHRMGMSDIFDGRSIIGDFLSNMEKICPP